LFIFCQSLLLAESFQKNEIKKKLVFLFRCRFPYRQNIDLTQALFLSSQPAIYLLKHSFFFATGFIPIFSFATCHLFIET